MDNLKLTVDMFLQQYISKYIEKTEMRIALLESEGHLGAS